MSSSVAPGLTVRVLLFGSYADARGFYQVDLTLASPATLDDVIAHLRALAGGDRLPPKPLCARNLAHVGAGEPIASGDELALLPPLAGG